MFNKLKEFGSSLKSNFNKITKEVGSFVSNNKNMVKNILLIGATTTAVQVSANDNITTHDVFLNQKDTPNKVLKKSEINTDVSKFSKVSIIDLSKQLGIKGKGNLFNERKQLFNSFFDGEKYNGKGSQNPRLIKKIHTFLIEGGKKSDLKQSAYGVIVEGKKDFHVDNDINSVDLKKDNEMSYEEYEKILAEQNKGEETIDKKNEILTTEQKQNIASAIKVGVSEDVILKMKNNYVSQNNRNTTNEALNVEGGVKWVNPKSNKEFIFVDDKVFKVKDGISKKLSGGAVTKVREAYDRDTKTKTLVNYKTDKLKATKQYINQNTKVTLGLEGILGDNNDLRAEAGVAVLYLEKKLGTSINIKKGGELEKFTLGQSALINGHKLKLTLSLLKKVDEYTFGNEWKKDIELSQKSYSLGYSYILSDNLLNEFYSNIYKSDSKSKKVGELSSETIDNDKVLRTTKTYGGVAGGDSLLAELGLALKVSDDTKILVDAGYNKIKIDGLGDSGIEKKSGYTFGIEGIHNLNNQNQIGAGYKTSDLGWKEGSISYNYNNGKGLSTGLGASYVDYNLEGREDEVNVKANIKYSFNWDGSKTNNRILFNKKEYKELTFSDVEVNNKEAPDIIKVAKTKVWKIITKEYNKPSIENISDISIDEGENDTVSIVVENLEGNTLSYALSETISGVTIDSSSGVITLSPSFSDSGDYSGIKVIVTDTVTNKKFESKTFSININDVNLDITGFTTSNSAITYDNTLDFSWDNNVNADEIQISLNAGSTWITLPGNTTTYTSTILVDGIYEPRIRSVTNSINSEIKLLSDIEIYTQNPTSMGSSYINAPTSKGIQEPITNITLDEKLIGGSIDTITFVNGSSFYGAGGISISTSGDLVINNIETHNNPINQEKLLIPYTTKSGKTGTLEFVFPLF